MVFECVISTVGCRTRPSAGRKKKRRVRRNEETGGNPARQIQGTLVRTFAFSHKIKNDRIFSIEYKASKNDGFVTVIRPKPGKGFEAVGGEVTPEVGTKWGLGRDQAEILQNDFPEKGIGELMSLIGRSSRTEFRDQVLTPLLDAGLIEMTIQDSQQAANKGIGGQELEKQFLNQDV